MIGLGERVATHGLNQAAGRRQMRRVLSLEQVHAANSDYTATITQRGAKLKIDYQHMCTEVTAVEDASSDAGKKLTYQFNDGGNVVCVRDELGYARFTKYDSAIENTPCSVQRNIAGLVDGGSNIVVKCKYDVWRKPTLKRSLTTACDALPMLNPFRYCGYMYDWESEKWIAHVHGQPIDIEMSLCQSFVWLARNKFYKIQRK